MGEGKPGRAQLQQQSESWAMPRPGRRYHWDPKVHWYRLAEVDGERLENGPLLDMDFSELDLQMQSSAGGQRAKDTKTPTCGGPGARRNGSALALMVGLAAAYAAV